MQNIHNLTPEEMVIVVKDCFDVIKNTHEIYLKFHGVKSTEHGYIYPGNRKTSVIIKTYDLGSFGKYTCTSTDWSFNIQKSRPNIINDEDYIIHTSRMREINDYNFRSHSNHNTERYSYNFSRVGSDGKRSIYVIENDSEHDLKIIKDLEEFIFQQCTIMDNVEAVFYSLSCLIYEAQLPYINIVMNLNLVLNSYMNLNFHELLKAVKFNECK